MRKNEYSYSNPLTLLLIYTKKPLLMLFVMTASSFIVAIFYSMNNEKNEILIVKESSYFWIEVGIILILAIIIAFIIAKISKRKKMFVLYFLTLNIAVMNIITGVINGYIIINNVDASVSRNPLCCYILVGLGALLVSAIWLITVLKTTEKVTTRNIVTAIISWNLGSILSLLFPINYYIVIIITLALFDIYSVFKGPIKEIFAIPQNVAIFTTTVGVGFGDLVFYTSLVTFFTFNYGLTVGLYAMVNVIIGVKITLMLTAKYKRFPGLPIPTLLTMVLSYLAIVLIKVV